MPYKDIEKRRAYMKDYMREYERTHKKERRASNKAYVQRARKIVDEYKASRGCCKCGEMHIGCLDLHHLNPEEKALNPADMVRDGWGPKHIQEELNKCIVLCANCHRKLHWEERQK